MTADDLSDLLQAAKIDAQVYLVLPGEPALQFDIAELHISTEPPHRVWLIARPEAKPFDPATTKRIQFKRRT